VSEKKQPTHVHHHHHHRHRRQQSCESTSSLDGVEENSDDIFDSISASQKRPPTRAFDDNSDGLLFGMDEERPKATDNAESSHSYAELVRESRLARVRLRFPVAVVVLNGNAICRSATLAHKFELMLHSTLSTTSRTPDRADDDNDDFDGRTRSDYDGRASGSIGEHDELSDSEADHADVSSVERARRKDIELLHLLRVKYIVDLMVEDRKKKLGVSVCSSEKVDRKGRYNAFGIASMPYPGCEFFAEFALRNDASALQPTWLADDPSGGNATFNGTCCLGGLCVRDACACQRSRR
jgi:hypothetical protein